ncbi:hypothetical protein G5V58_11340 [Nocardioides anomalus]|uniref:Uncharacterized protein n=1 Tax=Nocardioides anomalus TaxID=2712223 RepID=A0A6G6WDF2_9ACTN|nr:hypothetical protein [Nocardioides anomalus]QIG43272.1 hypothetical protein G5V58_11340 [Nocardioides anomalus]
MDDDADGTHRLVPMVLPVGLMVTLGAACLLVALGVRGNLLWVAAFVVLVGGGLAAMVLLARPVAPEPEPDEAREPHQRG